MASGPKLQHPDPKALDPVQVARTSVFVTLFLIAAKLAIGLSTNSLAILSQAADSGFDLIAVLITLLAVRISSTPPDEDHQFGHGKFESLSALVQSLLLLGITIYIANEAIAHLTGKHDRVVEVNGWSFGVLFVSIGLDLWRAKMLRKAGKEHRSHALEASALNFFTDILSAIVALIGLALLKFGNVHNADDYAALALCLFVAWLSVRLGKKAIDGLTDRMASSEDYEKLKHIVEKTGGVQSVSRLRIRQAGPSLFVDVSVTIDRILPYAAIERIISEVEREIGQEYQDSDVTVHWKAVRKLDEAPFETLKVLIAEFGVLPHNIELSENAQGGIALDYHLEFPPGTAFREAHSVSDEIAKRIRQELPQISQLYTHLEEERSDSRLPQMVDVTESRADLSGEIKRYAKAANPGVLEVERINLFEESQRRNLKLMLTLSLEANITLAEAHDISTNVEEELRKRFPELTRIVIEANANWRR